MIPVFILEGTFSAAILGHLTLDGRQLREIKVTVPAVIFSHLSISLYPESIIRTPIVGTDYMV